jgi:TRAP-type C4-dicarboxylate transport system permease small subunit
MSELSEPESASIRIAREKNLWGYLARATMLLTQAGNALGAVFLIGIMVLIVVNVISRRFGFLIPGTYEMIEIMIIVTAGFAMAYTALRKGHTQVGFEISSGRKQAVIDALVGCCEVITVALITWNQFNVLLDKIRLGEETELLHITYAPFRALWVFGLLLLCVAFLIDLGGTVGRVVKK